MSSVSELHGQAMSIADEAFDARRRGDAKLAHELFEAALVQERSAAELLEDDVEPSRSVLLRSAATLALHAGELDEAGRLIAAGLAGRPPGDIAEELQDLLGQLRDECRRMGRTLPSQLQRNSRLA